MFGQRFTFTPTQTTPRRRTPVTRGHPLRGFIKQTNEDHEKEQVNRTWNRLEG